MAEIQNKSLEQLIQSFTTTANQTKDLDNAISNFSHVTNNFNETLIAIEGNFPLKEMSELSQDALKRLNEIKVFNEYQIFEKIEDIISKSISMQFKDLENRLEDNNRSQFNELKKSLDTIEVTAVSEDNDKYDKILGLLQEQDNTYNQEQSNSEEYLRLERRIDKLIIDFKKTEIEYEDRIASLEEEIKKLKKEKNVDTFLIDDSDFPW